ncbi:MAG: TetR/AcrR family transcriptional regulator [Pontibacterium sp.]
MPRKTKAQAEQTRKDLIQAALELYDQLGPEKTSVKAVASHAQVTHGAFYWHFANRSALVTALYDDKTFALDDVFFEHLQFAQQNGLLALKEYTRAWVAYVLGDEERFLVWRLFYCPGAPLANEPVLAQRLHDDQALWLERLTKLIKKAKKQKRLNPAYAKSPSKLAYVVLAMVNGILAQQVAVNGQAQWAQQPEGTWQSQLDIFYQGIAKQ